MNVEDLKEKIRIWDFTIADNGTGVADSKYGRIMSQIEYFAEHEWKTYLPAEHSSCSPNYLDRLAKWIGNLETDEDQKLLLEYALHISFFSQADFTALYRTAYIREISRWVAIQENLKVKQGQYVVFNEHLLNELRHSTWYCPVTDSMKINDFCHVNHLEGISEHPCFSTFFEFARTDDEANDNLVKVIKKYIERKKLKRLVLLEDFVGSARQCCHTIGWAAKALEIPVLFLPLIICPKGLKKLSTDPRTANIENLLIKSIIRLTENDLLGEERNNSDGWQISKQVEELATRTRTLVIGNQKERNSEFGFLKTGCSVVTYSNTPNNSLPMIHNIPSERTWTPIFPRVIRE